MWLHDGLADRLSTKAADAIESGRLYISPMVELELQYLHEIGRVRFTARSVIGRLQRDIGLQIGEASFSDIVSQACVLDWTRDPFDLPETRLSWQFRLRDVIIGHAALRYYPTEYLIMTKTCASVLRVRTASEPLSAAIDSSNGSSSLLLSAG